MMFLKKAKHFQPERTLKFLLHEHLTGPEDGRPYSRIHASELTRPEGLCPRLYALADAAKVKPPNQWLTTSQEVTYHMGRVLQDSVVNWFADMGRAFGHWKCVGCGMTHEFQKRPIKCSQCGVKKFDPKEMRFESAINGASAGIDMCLTLGETQLRIVELKTMDKDEFKALLAPLAEHKLRTNLYLRIIAESEQPWAKQINTQSAKILYISKGGYGCADPSLKALGLKDQYSPFKEFEIVRNDADTNEIVKRAQAVTDFRRETAGMPHGLCTTAMAKRAQTCVAKKHCFSGEYPPINEWKST